MLSFNLDSSLQDAVFETDKMLGAETPEIKSRVSLGEIVGRRLTRDLVVADPAIQEWSWMLDDADFYAVGFACTLVEMEDEHIRDAAVSVMLVAGEGTAVAWSMAPVRLDSAPPSPTPGFRVGGTIAVPFFVGPKLELDLHNDPYVKNSGWIVLAAGMRESDPEWNFQRRKGQNLDGPPPMSMIVKAPRGTSIDVQCELRATIDHPRFGLSFVRAKYPELAAKPEARLVLSAS